MADPTPTPLPVVAPAAVKRKAVEVGLGRLLNTFQTPNLQGFVKVLLEQVEGTATIEGLEPMWCQLLDDRSIDTAVGAQQDGLGRIVVRERQGDSDTTYRSRLRVQILLNRANGTIPELYELLDVLEGAGEAANWIITELFPAGIKATKVGPPLTSLVLVAEIICGAVEAGVSCYAIGAADSDPIWIWDNDARTQTGATVWDNDTRTGGGVRGDWAALEV